MWQELFAGVEYTMFMGRDGKIYVLVYWPKTHAMDVVSVGVSVTHSEQK